MHKLKLDPEMLAVESFVADEAADDATGTVRAYSFVTVQPHQACGSDEPSANCTDSVDVHLYTCGNSCINMCFHTGPEAGCVD
jgi:hypothetical protein